MRFEHDGQTYSLSFPRKDVPVLPTISQRLRLKPDQPPPTRRETTAQLMRLATELEKPLWVETMRATVRRYFKDEPLTNEQARVQALKALLHFVPLTMHNVIRHAYYSRPRGKKARAVNMAKP